MLQDILPTFPEKESLFQHTQEELNKSFFFPLLLLKKTFNFSQQTGVGFNKTGFDFPVRLIKIKLNLFSQSLSVLVPLYELQHVLL